MAATRADVLSQALTLVRLRGELVYSAQLRTPWSIAFPKGAAHFHFVEQGAIWIATLGVDLFTQSRATCCSCHTAMAT
jgi:hypothetical protein